MNGKKYYKDWPEMKKWLKGKKITDESGHTISVKNFIEMVEEKQDANNSQGDYGAEVIGGYTFSDGEFS